MENIRVRKEKIEEAEDRQLSEEERQMMCIADRCLKTAADYYLVEAPGI